MSSLPHLIKLKSRTGTASNGHPVYADPVEIKARYMGRRGLVRNAQGEQVVSSARFLTRHSVKPGDAIIWRERQWSVIDVIEQISISGKTAFYEALI